MLSVMANFAVMVGFVVAAFIIPFHSLYRSSIPELFGSYSSTFRVLFTVRPARPHGRTHARTAARTPGRTHV